nr:hypothetical protein [Tanacetum cinerariifolium]
SQTNDKHGLGYFSSKSDSESLSLSSSSDRLQPSGGYHLSPTKPAQDMSHTNRQSAPIITDWVSDSEDKSKPNDPQSVPSFVQSSEQVKTPRHSAQPIKNASFTHKHPQKHMVPAAVLTQSKPVSITAARSVCAYVPKIMVTRPRHAHSINTKTKSPIRRHITRSPSLKTSNSSLRVTAAQALVQASASGTQTDKAPVYDSDGSPELHNYENCYDNEIFNMFTPEEQYTELLEPISEPHQVTQNDNIVIFEDYSVEQSGKRVEQHPANVEETLVLYDSLYNNLAIEVEKVNTVNHKLKETNAELTTELARFKHQEKCFEISQEKYDKLERCYQKSVYQEQCLSKKINALHLSFEATKFVRDFKSLAKEVDESLAKHKALELEIERLLRAVNDWYKKCEECKYDKISYDKAYNDMQQKIERLQAQLGDLKGKSKDTSRVSDTLNPLSQKLENENVELEINPFMPSKEEKHVPNKVRASVRTKPITVSQTPIITKKVVNSDSNGLSSTGVDNTKTRRTQPRSNTKNDRVPSASKSSRSKNKEVEVEEHHRKLLLFRNKKHMSSECNNVKLATQNVKSKVFCTMCKQCLNSVNHDVCLLNYVNGMNSHGKKQKANVSINEHQKKQKTKVKKTKKVGSIERLASPKPSKPRSFLRNDHVAAILGFGDLQWGNILITKVYFVEGLAHNLFSVGQFCDSDLESWLWHQRLSHLNFDTINNLAKNDLVSGLPKFKYHKEHLCPSCEQGKSKRASHPPKPVPNSRQRLHLLHMDLCGPMRIASINGKRYVLVIVDNYSRYTWVHFLRSKDKAPEVIKTFLKRITVLLHVGISHQMSSVRTPQQNGVMERRNRMLVETARTMLIFSRAPIFLWAEAIATALCHPKNDREDIRKLGAKGDIGFFIGYSADSCAYRVYNRRKKKIMETMNVSFDELSAMAFEHRSSKPRLQSMTSRQINSGLDLTYAPSTITTQQTTKGELDLLFEAIYDDYIGGQPSNAPRTVLATQAHQVRQTPTTSTSIADTTPTPTNSSSQATNFPNTLQDVDELNSQQQHAQQLGNQAPIQPEIIVDNVPNAMFDANTVVNPFATPSTSSAESSSSQYVDPSNMHKFYQPYPHEFQWTKDHPLEQVIGEPSRPVLIRNQLRSDGDMCMYALTVSSMEPKNVKEAMTDPAWIESMQKELP